MDLSSNLGGSDHRNPSSPDFWSAKIASLFHDPLLKPWVERHHEFAADNLPEFVKKLDVGGIPVEDLVRRHHEGIRHPLCYADWNSSSVERVIAELVHARRVTFIHPLSGMELRLGGESRLESSLSKEEVAEIAERMRQRLNGLAKELLGGLKQGNDWQRQAEAVKVAYLISLRCLEPIYLKAAREVLGDRAAFLVPPPADRRTPNHTVSDHVESTSALTTCCHRESLEACLVSFDVGGVQPFILAARKTSDLWAASWLTSLLAWSALRGVCDLIGLDAVVFPYIKGNPFADAWISKIVSGVTSVNQRGVLQKILEVDGFSEEDYVKKLTLSLIPPSATILAPKELADEVKKRLEGCLRDCWKQLTSLLWSELEKLFSNERSGEFLTSSVRERWRRQTENLPLGPVRIVVTEFPATEHEIANFLDKYERMIPRSVAWVMRRILQIEEKQERKLGVRPALVYGAVFAINSTKMGMLIPSFKEAIEPSVKSELDCPEGGIVERCNLCGVRNPLFLGKDPWKVLADEGIIEWDPLHDRGEYLCSVCLMKRILVRRAAFQDVLMKCLDLPRDLVTRDELSVKFPSTSDFAAFCFKRTLIDRIDDEIRGKLIDFHRELRNLKEKLEKEGVRLELDSEQPPLLAHLLSRLPKEVAKALRIAGEFFDTDTYHRLLGRLAEDGRARLRPAVDAVIGSLRELVNLVTAKDLRGREAGSPPYLLEPYATDVGDTFALLSSDGDYMGEWISGIRLPPLHSSVPEECRAELRRFLKEEGAEELADEPRPLSPVVHVTISHALMRYARDVLPGVVENFGGAVVYAGGDDALVFVPPEYAFQTAQLMAEEFMREWDNGLGHVTLGFGHRSSFSAGVFLSHYMYHLARAIEGARGLMDRAKELDGDRRRGKGAVAAELYGRAGPIAVMSEPLHWIEPWRPDEMEGLREFVRPLSQRDRAWVGVSHLTADCDLFIAVLTALRSGQLRQARFFSPLIMATQLGALVRDGLGELERLNVGRDILSSSLEDCVRLGTLSPDVLFTLFKRTASRAVHTGRDVRAAVVGGIIGVMSDLLNAMDRDVRSWRSVLEASAAADRALYFARVLPTSFELPAGRRWAR